MDYKRLTKRDVVGTCVNIYEFANEVKKWQDKHGLYDYIGADAMQILLERLADLEDKIENGTLVELPCKVGDTFWYISIVGYIEEDKIADIFLRDGVCLGERLVTKIYLRDLGAKWFLTKAEAEAKLRELKEMKNNGKRI